MNGQITSTYFEPACGTGNYLAEIINRKLSVVKKQYGRSHHDYEKYSIQRLICPNSV